MFDVARSAQALHTAFNRLRARDGLAEALRRDLLSSAGLSTPMIEWALQTSLPDDRALLIAAAGQAPQGQRRSDDPKLAVILSGNVFTASVRALAWPLLLGFRVIAKAASRDDVMPHALKRALDAADAELGARLQVVTFDRDDRDASMQLVRDCDVVSVYGSDATIEAVRSLLAPGTTLIAHGHGLGALIVTARALRDPSVLREWAAHAALDIAAYDQRGCLSPQVIYVEDVSISARADVAYAIAIELRQLDHSLPRGPLPQAVAIAQSQWRGAMAARGTLIEDKNFALAIPDDDTNHDLASPLAPSPGYRNIELRSYRDIDALRSALKPLHAHLKALGVAGDHAACTAIEQALPSALRPMVCRAGTMQTPSFDAWADGQPPWFGLR